MTLFVPAVDSPSTFILNSLVRLEWLYYVNEQYWYIKSEDLCLLISTLVMILSASIFKLSAV